MRRPAPSLALILLATPALAQQPLRVKTENIGGELGQGVAGALSISLVRAPVWADALFRRRAGLCDERAICARADGQ